MSTFLDNLRDTACMTDGYEREPFGEWLHAELDRHGWEPTVPIRCQRHQSLSVELSRYP